MSQVIGQVTDAGQVGVFGESTQFEGVRGVSHSIGHGGVVGINDNQSDNAGQGVFGLSEKGEGIRGMSHSPHHGGVVGSNDNTGAGVHGESSLGEGVRGISHGPFHAAVVGTNDDSSENAGAGVFGESKNGEGVRGISHSALHAAVVGTNDNPSGVGVFGKAERLAGQFVGNVHVTGNILADGDIVLSNADCAEDFNIVDADLVEPGTVMVVGDEGVLQQSEQAYDKRVAGVISGVGNYKPGIVLDKQHSQPNRKPIALLGKVYCKVDASYAPVEVGDLLTTAPTPGHAMKAIDPFKAFGAVIGKALRPLREGQGLVPILIALQ